MNKFTRISLTGLFVSAMLVFGAGSLDYDDYGTWTDYTSYSTIPITQGAVKEGLTIKAVDGSFTLRGGRQFTTPFTSSLWDSECPYTFNSSTLLSQINEAKRCGAKEVRVKVDGMSKELYGVLAFNPKLPSSYGPSANSYYIQVRPDKLESAKNGGTTVSFEMVKFKTTAGYSNSTSRTTTDKNGFGWVLWLSSFPM